MSNLMLDNNTVKKDNIMRKILKASDYELELHKKFLKSSLPKNYHK